MPSCHHTFLSIGVSIHLRSIKASIHPQWHSYNPRFLFASHFDRLACLKRVTDRTDSMNGLSDVQMKDLNI